MRSPDAGYIYILQNESLEPDRLKIGRTHHHPEFRAEELSQATGIPTPFTVAWYGRTEDCIKAERLIHRSLSAYRTNPKREFFDVDLDEAIDAGEEAVKISGRRLNWFYRPREQWNIDPDYPPTFGGFFSTSSSFRFYVPHSSWSCYVSARSGGSSRARCDFFGVFLMLSSGLSLASAEVTQNLQQA